MPFWATFRGLRLLFYLLLGSRYCPWQYASEETLGGAAPFENLHDSNSTLCIDEMPGRTQVEDAPWPSSSILEKWQLLLRVSGVGFWVLGLRFRDAKRIPLSPGMYLLQCKAFSQPSRVEVYRDCVSYSLNALKGIRQGII